MTLHIRIDQAIDVVTLLLWIFFIPAIWLTGERLISAAQESEGGGSSYPLKRGADISWCTATPHPRMSGFYVNPTDRVRMLLPLVTNFFQRPWAVGVPAMCLALILIVHCARLSKRDNRALVVLFAVVCALPTIEAAIYATLVLAAGSCLLARFIWKREASVVEGGIERIVATLGSSRTHGMFVADAQAGVPFRLSLEAGGIGHGFGYSVLWNVLSFGVRLPLGIAGLWLCAWRKNPHLTLSPEYELERGQEGMGRGRSILVLMAAVSFVMLNCFRYNYTADIIKFATLLSIPLSFGTTAVLCQLVGSRSIDQKDSLRRSRAGDRRAKPGFFFFFFFFWRFLGWQSAAAGRDQALCFC